MKLDVRYAYPCSVESYWSMYWDEAFDAKLQANSDVGRVLLEEFERDGVLTRKLRFTPARELPAAIATFTGTKTLVYDQVNHFDRAASTMTWEVLPTFISADKFQAKGLFRVLPKGDGCELVVTGDIDVKIRFVGGTIEQQVVSQIKEAYARMHTATVEWLANNKVN